MPWPAKLANYPRRGSWKWASSPIPRRDGRMVGGSEGRRAGNPEFRNSGGRIFGGRSRTVGALEAAALGFCIQCPGGWAADDRKRGWSEFRRPEKTAGLGRTD
jgi:hypothetical protein